MTQNFGSNQLMIEKLFECFYLTMIAEWYYVDSNGNPSRLKHRIKQLGVYQVLFQYINPQDAAEYSKNKSSKQLDFEMKKYGF